MINMRSCDKLKKINLFFYQTYLWPLNLVGWWLQGAGSECKRLRRLQLLVPNSWHYLSFRIALGRLSKCSENLCQFGIKVCNELSALEWIYLIAKCPKDLIITYSIGDFCRIDSIDSCTSFVRKKSFFITRVSKMPWDRNCNIWLS